MNAINKQVSAAILILSASLFGYSASASADDTAVQTVKVIKISSKRYEFTPNTLTLKKGETVDLELTTADVTMGFSVPDMGARATIPPGQVTHLRLTPQKVGTYAFLCDVFCGSGHEDMNGTITVIE